MSPTHRTQCVVCEEVCYCANDTHALGCGGFNGEGGCERPPFIEFCSLACAEELARRLDDRIAIYKDLAGLAGEPDDAPGTPQ